MANALMPAALAVSSFTEWLKPVHMMMGMSGLTARISLASVNTRHLGHGLIRNDEIEPGGVQPEERQGLPAAHPGCHVVAELGKDIFTHLHEGLLVIDKEDALGARGERVVIDRVGFGLSCNLGK